MTLTPPRQFVRLDEVELTIADRDLVVDALTTDARRRQRAATIAATELDDEQRAGITKDPRSGAVQIARLLAEAGRLEATARLVAAARMWTRHTVTTRDPDTGEERDATKAEILATAGVDPAELEPTLAAEVVEEHSKRQRRTRTRLAVVPPEPQEAEPVSDTPTPARRSEAEAIAESKRAIAEAGLAVTAEDRARDLDDLDDLDPALLLDDPDAIRTGAAEALAGADAAVLDGIGQEAPDGP